jgi:peptide/nickel transport system permease protein
MSGAGAFATADGDCRTTMLTYILRRILATIPVMATVALFVFGLLYLAPGDPATMIGGDQASPEDIRKIREGLGLDRPFVVRFAEWVGQMVQGDLGKSIFTALPVTAMIKQRIEPTLSLAAITLVLSLLIAVPLGVLAAWKAGTWIDRVVMAIAVFGFSVPVFVVGYMLSYVFGLELKWFPVQGYSYLSQGIGPWLNHLVLPAIALAAVYIALIARITRATMLDVLAQDYVRTARAKGLAQPAILFVHALKNAAVPIVTVIGIGMALLLGGAVVTESVFVIPGLGSLTIDSILRRDYPVIQGLVLLFSVVYVLVNLLVDVTYTLFDPRIRY